MLWIVFQLQAIMRVDDAHYDGCLICFNGQVSVFEMLRVTRIGELYVKCGIL